MTVFLLLLVCLSIFSACSSIKLKTEIPVTGRIKPKKGEVEEGVYVDSLKVEVVRRLPDGSYILAYTIFGQLPYSDEDKCYKLTNVRHMELDLNSSSEPREYDRSIIITPVFKEVSKKNCSTSFSFKNEILVDYYTRPIRNVEFFSVNEDVIFELPQTIDKK